MVVDLKALVLTMTEEDRHKILLWVIQDWEKHQLQAGIVDDLLISYSDDPTGFLEFLESSLPDDEDEVTEIFEYLNIS